MRAVPAVPLGRRFPHARRRAERGAPPGGRRRGHRAHGRPHGDATGGQLPPPHPGASVPAPGPLQRDHGDASRRQHVRHVLRRLLPAETGEARPRGGREAPRDAQRAPHRGHGRRAHAAQLDRPPLLPPRGQGFLQHHGGRDPGRDALPAPPLPVPPHRGRVGQLDLGHLLLCAPVFLVPQDILPCARPPDPRGHGFGPALCPFYFRHDILEQQRLRDVYVSAHLLVRRGKAPIEIRARRTRRRSRQQGQIGIPGQHVPRDPLPAQRCPCYLRGPLQQRQHGPRRARTPAHRAGIGRAPSGYPLRRAGPRAGVLGTDEAGSVCICVPGGPACRAAPGQAAGGPPRNRVCRGCVAFGASRCSGRSQEDIAGCCEPRRERTQVHLQRIGPCDRRRGAPLRCGLGGARSLRRCGRHPPSGFGRDTGVGIPAEKQGSIFDAFTQVDGSFTRRHGGSGLGLAISQQLAELMDGSLVLRESYEGVGSEFLFAVPVSSCDDEALSEVEWGSPPRDLEVTMPPPSPQASLPSGFADFWTASPALVGLPESAWTPPESDAAGRSDMPGLLHSVVEEKPPLSPDPARPGSIPQQKAPLPPEDRQSYRARSPESSAATAPIPPPLPSPSRRSTMSGSLTAKSPTSPSAGLSSVPLRLLVAEDNKINQLVIERMLKKMGHSIRMCENGQEALGELESRRGEYDAVVSDIQMPVMDGIELVQRIREGEGKGAWGPSRLPAIAVTAHALDQDRALCLEAGFDDWIPKPVDRGKLLAALEAATEALRASGHLFPQ